MNKDKVKELIYILVAIVLGILIVKFVIWLLPILLIGICSYYIYKSMKKNRVNKSNFNSDKKIIDMEDDK